MLSLLLIVAVAAAMTVKRGHPEGWKEMDADSIDDDAPVAFRLALHQKNVDVLETMTLDRANPAHALYGQWMTPTQVLDLISPKPHVVAAVVAWAKDLGLSANGDRRDIVLVSGSKKAVELALNTRLRAWMHLATGETRVGTLEYSLPDEVAQHVEMVVGLQEFWLKPKGGARRLADRKRNSVSSGYVIPDTVRKLYNVPKNDPTLESSLSSIAVAEFQDNAGFLKSDLALFEKQTGESNTRVDKIVGPYTGENPNGESALDIEYGATIGGSKSQYWFWTVKGWMMEFSNDLFSTPNGPKVVSMSWGWPSPAQCEIAQCSGITSQGYVKRVDVEFLKITATGVSLLASSGDQGAPGDSFPECQGVSDIYPGSSPWVTSVGATMLDDSAPNPPPPANAPPICSQFACASKTQEVACSTPEALITTGGGFAAFTAMPSWQKSAVQQYLALNLTMPPAHLISTNNRAFPDISAAGHAVLIAINGQFEQVDGTSCSSPIVAGMVALLNGWRLNQGRSTLGFLNPLLYTAFSLDASVFKPITKGNNYNSESCSGASGHFGYLENPVPGWSPVTGLGAPRFDKLLALVKELP